MVAKARVEPEYLLACNCRMVLRRGIEERQVQAQAWDCPSCGLDKRRKLALMAEVAAVSQLHPRMFTFTFDQPRADEAVPARHYECDPDTHIYAYRERDGSVSFRWRLLSSCKHCCAFVSGALARVRKRLRRRFGSQVDYLWVKEDHPRSGAIHLHVLMLGLPPAITRHNRAGRWIKRAWKECGGGHLDLGSADPDMVGRKVGWYIGKYLAKRNDLKMAKGYRRWGRTRKVAPEVLMRQRFGDPKPWLQPAQDIDMLGWKHPLSHELGQLRVWLELPTVEASPP